MEGQCALSVPGATGALCQDHRMDHPLWAFKLQQGAFSLNPSYSSAIVTHRHTQNTKIKDILNVISHGGNLGCDRGSH